MSKEITVDEEVRKILRQRSENLPVSYGLLLGQRTARNDFIIHIVKSDKENFKGPMREIEVEAIADHSLSVTMMLPGGFWVLGIYLITSEELWNTERNNAKCREILKLLRHKLLSKGIYRGISPSDDLILLQFNPSDQETLCWRFDYGENHIDIQVTDVVFQTLSSCFYEGEYVWNFTSPYKEISTSDLINDQNIYWDQIKEFENQVIDSSLLLNDEEMPDEKVIFTEYLDSKGYLNEEASLHENIEHKKRFNVYVCLLKPISNYTNGAGEEQNIVRDKFYIHKDATVMEVCRAIKDDMVRSWASTLHINIERLLESACDRKGRMKKVYILLEHSKVPFYSYIFDTEPLCLKRLHDLLHENLSLTKSDNFLLLDRDMLKDYEEEKSTDCFSSFKERVYREENGLNNNFVYILAFVAILMAYITLIYNGMLKNKYNLQ